MYILEPLLLVACIFGCLLLLLPAWMGFSTAIEVAVNPKFRYKVKALFLMSLSKEELCSITTGELSFLSYKVVHVMFLYFGNPGGALAVCVIAACSAYYDFALCGLEAAVELRRKGQELFSVTRSH